MDFPAFKTTKKTKVPHKYISKFSGNDLNHDKVRQIFIFLFVVIADLMDSHAANSEDRMTGVD